MEVIINYYIISRVEVRALVFIKNQKIKKNIEQMFVQNFFLWGNFIWALKLLHNSIEFFGFYNIQKHTENGKLFFIVLEF